MIIQLTLAQQIAKNYSAAIDSVNLINQLMSKPIRTAEEVDTVHRNVDHLKIMLSKTYWTTEDLTPLSNAVIIGANP